MRRSTEGGTSSVLEVVAPDDERIDDERIDDEDTVLTRRVLRSGRRRTALAVVAVVAVVALFVAGWSAARAFESPAQRAARATPPPAGVVTAAVSDGSLERTLSATATIGRVAPETVTVAASLASAVVTKQTVAVGGQLGAGSVALEVNGRPLLALPGAFPYYRALTLGDQGPDVRQLQAGLVAAGIQVTEDGRFGATTARAVTALYTRAGYSVPTTEVPTTEVPSAPAADGTAAADGTVTSSATSSDARSTGSSASPAAGSSTGTSGAGTSGTGTSGAGPTAAQVSVPAAELVVFSTLPADVLTVPSVGTILTATSGIGVESGAVVASAPVAASAAGTLRVGMTGTLTGPDGTQADVAITSIDTAGEPTGAAAGEAASGVSGSGTPSTGSGPASASSGSSGSQSASSGGVTIGGAEVSTDPPASEDSTVRLSAAGGDGFPAAWLHGSGVAVITVSVAAQHSLIVPSIAVVSGAKGAAHVLKRGPDGSYVSVPVTEIGTLEGKSAVRPTTAGALRAGDAVKVG